MISASNPSKAGAPRSGAKSATKCCLGGTTSTGATIGVTSVVVKSRRGTIVNVIPGETGEFTITHDAGKGAHFGFEHSIEIHRVTYFSETEAKVEYTVYQDAEPGAITLCIANTTRALRITDAVVIGPTPAPHLCLANVDPAKGAQGQAITLAIIFQDPIADLPGVEIEGLEFDVIRRTSKSDAKEMRKVHIDPDTVIYAEGKIAEDARVGRRDVTVYFCGGQPRVFPCRFEVTASQHQGSGPKKDDHQKTGKTEDPSKQDVFEAPRRHHGEPKKN